MFNIFTAKKCFLYIMASLICFSPSLASENELLVVTETWPPFRIIDKDNDSQYTGIDIDLLKEISKRLKVKIIIKQYPWARCLSMIRSGQGDIITGLAFTKQRAQFVHYSKIPYYSVSPAFYLRIGEGNKVKKYDDLYGLTIGYSLNSAYFDRFDSDTKIRKIGVPKEILLIKMLVNNRLDVIIGTNTNVDYDIAQLALNGKIEKSYYSPNERTELYIGVSKKSDFLHRCDELDAIITKLVETGIIERIAKKYFTSESNK